MNILSTKHKQLLKAKAHALKPVVLIGNNGFSEAVQKEINLALDHHELIKIRVASNDRDARKALFVEICKAVNAQMIQTIGNIAVLYRKREE